MSMLRQNAKLARFARQCDEFRLTRKNRGFCAYDINVNSGHGQLLFLAQVFDCERVVFIGLKERLFADRNHDGLGIGLRFGVSDD